MPAKKTINKDFPSELRFDVVSKDWVVIAKGRAKRPEAFKRKEKRVEAMLEKDCPFCNIETQLKPVLVLENGKKVSAEKDLPKNWTTVVIPNKFPAFAPSDELNDHIEGPLYQVMNAVGFHEVVVFRSHKKQLADFSEAQMKEVFDVYQQRYLEMAKQRFVNYILIFHNHGPSAGASMAHPHSQIITTPLIDAGLRGALATGQAYFERHKKCVYCQMNQWEKKVGERIIFENEDFLAICPFASKTAFEVIISPKKHQPHFEEIGENEKQQLAQVFSVALKKINKALSDPDYNFYLHTAPCDGEKHDSYHWHWTIMPKTSIQAGFEMGAKMEISTIEPEKAAEYLRKQ